MNLTQFLTNSYALALLIFVPLAAGLLLMALPRTWGLTIRLVSIIAGGITLVISSLMLYDYWTMVHSGAVSIHGATDFFAIWKYDNPAVSKLLTLSLHGQQIISLHLTTDGAGVAMCFLTALTICAGVFASWNLKERTKEYLALLLLLVAGVFGVFVSADLFFFFLFYEIAVLPMYLLIAIWGTGQKEYSAMKLTLMLLMGSALIITGFIFLYAKTGTFDLIQLVGLTRIVPFSPEVQRWLFLAFYLGFGVLAGIFPFHTWSPDGHASAPTATSMLHAGVLMKLGGFGLLRVAVPLLPQGLHDLQWIIVIVATINIVYGAFSAMGQKDLKYVIAYSSVSHLGMVMLGMAAGTVTAMNGAVFQMFAHGVMTALFFALVGLVYTKAHTRNIDAMGGLARVAPGLAVAFTIGGLSSFGLPGTGGFIAEFLVYMGTFVTKPVIAVIASTGILITSIYVLRLLRRVFFGELNKDLEHMEDAKTTEWVALAMTCVVIIAVGVWPKPMIDLISSAVQPVAHIVGIQ